jgi:hypothetical protein
VLQQAHCQGHSPARELLGVGGRTTLQQLRHQRHHQPHSCWQQAALLLVQVLMLGPQRAHPGDPQAWQVQARLLALLLVLLLVPAGQVPRCLQASNK